MIFLIILAPFIISFFNKILAFAQHYGLHNNDHNDYFSNSRTILLNKFWSFFYSNMNFHIEHHCYPLVPFYNLPKFHHEITKFKSHDNICYGWLNLIKDLKNKELFNF